MDIAQVDHIPGKVWLFEEDNAESPLPWFTDITADKNKDTAALPNKAKNTLSFDHHQTLLTCI